MSACGAGSWCVGYDRSARTAAEAGQCRLCPGCLGKAGADIMRLPHDYLGLEAALIPGRAEAGPVVSGGGGPAAAPLALFVDALQRKIHYALVAWEAPVRAAARLSPAPTAAGRPGWAVNRAARVIGARPHVLADLEPAKARLGWAGGPWRTRDGLAGVAELRELHRAARLVLGEDRPVWAMPGPCSGCGRSALRRQDGSETVYCEACDRRWTMDTYRRYCGMILGPPA